MELNPIEYCLKRKLRFASNKGANALAVEDLFDLPLTSDTGRTNLNDIAKGINRTLADDGESFVPSETKTANLEGTMMLEAVKRVIAIKVAERTEAAAAREKAAKREELLEALADAERGEMKKKTPDEIRAMLAAL
ncbi:hypothetical protein ACRQ5Q_15350 [Bradyrhizobium sp. PMVTL-01]|uniref:hypothetical protein n=1 Tax=Bradyrhizobium sp. PMVTL-01 TaxID=3434999 RepID=UPI003F6E69E0